MTNKQFPIDLDFQTFFCVQKNGLAYFTDNFWLAFWDRV